MEKLSGKTALVTGSTDGVGRRAMSARSCSLAYRLFFKTDPFALEEARHTVP